MPFPCMRDEAETILGAQVLNGVIVKSGARRRYVRLSGESVAAWHHGERVVKNGDGVVNEARRAA